MAPLAGAETKSGRLTATKVTNSNFRQSFTVLRIRIFTVPHKQIETAFSAFSIQIAAAAWGTAAVTGSVGHRLTAMALSKFTNSMHVASRPVHPEWPNKFHLMGVATSFLLLKVVAQLVRQSFSTTTYFHRTNLCAPILPVFAMLYKRIKIVPQANQKF